jgi:hypothetical protein
MRCDVGFKGIPGQLYRPEELYVSCQALLNDIDRMRFFVPPKENWRMNAICIEETTPA